MDIIERVAERFEVKLNEMTSGDYYFDKEGYREIALVLINATLEHLRDNVSEGMVEAGVGSDHGKTLGSRVMNCHRAMIDQALKELDA